MAKKKVSFIGGMGTGNALNDRDWITVIAALLYDKTAESDRLAKRLLSATKHGRQVRLVHLLYKGSPSTTTQMQKTLKMSRRTIFRYLNGLEDYGISLEVDESFRYRITSLPANFKRLLAKV